MNTRLLIAIITTLLDEAIIIGLILWGLPQLGINIPLYVVIIIVLAFAGLAAATFRIGTQTLKKAPLPGLTDMTGTEGITMMRLDPEGFVNIKGELWEARAKEGSIEKGIKVIVVAQDNLKLIVQSRQTQGYLQKKIRTELNTRL